MKYVAAIGCAILMAVMGTSQAWAHGGGGMSQGDLCGISKGYHTVHFSAYQDLGATDEQIAQLQQKEEFQAFCDGVPKTGKTTLTFDLVSDGLRKIPVAVRVVESAEGSDSETVLYIPQQVYPSGVVRAETDFPKAGRYAAILEVEEHPGRSHPGDATQEADHSGHGGAEAVSQKHASGAEEEAYHAYDTTFGFPFTVGLKTPRGGARGPSMMSNPAILATAVAGMAIGTVLYVRRKKKVA